MNFISSTNEEQTSSRISLFLWSRPGRSFINFSKQSNPPYCFISAAFADMDFGISCPPRSSMAAGRFKEARMLCGMTVSRFFLNVFVCEVI